MSSRLSRGWPDSGRVIRAGWLDANWSGAWGQLVSEPLSGVYVVSIVSDAAGTCGPIDVGVLDDAEAKRWLPSHPVIYIGRASSLSRRIKQFYRHRYGNSSPHRGGQAVKLISHIPQWVYWAPAPDFVEKESRLIEAFAEYSGQLPYANRRH